MANANLVILMGNLTRDPQLSYTPNQTAITEFGLATNRQWKDSGGSKREEVCFVDCKAFGITGENINKYLSKGDPIFIQGRLSFEQWTDKEGRKCSKHRVIIENMQFLGKAQQDEAKTSDEQTQQERTKNDDIPF